MWPGIIYQWNTNIHSIILCLAAEHMISDLSVVATVYVLYYMHSNESFLSELLIIHCILNMHN